MINVEAANLQISQFEVSAKIFLKIFFVTVVKCVQLIETNGPMYCSTNNQNCDPLEFLLSTDTWKDKLEI